MIVKLYVNWDAREILTTDEYEKEIREETLSLIDDEYEFNKWLENHYMPKGIWHLTEAERAEVLSLWEDYCRDSAEVNIGYEETLVEI